MKLRHLDPASLPDQPCPIDTSDRRKMPCDKITCPVHAKYLGAPDDMGCVAILMDKLGLRTYASRADFLSTHGVLTDGQLRKGLEDLNGAVEDLGRLDEYLRLPSSNSCYRCHCPGVPSGQHRCTSGSVCEDRRATILGILSLEDDPSKTMSELTASLPPAMPAPCQIWQAVIFKRARFLPPQARVTLESLLPSALKNSRSVK